MLILSRHKDESVIIGDDIVITVLEIRGDKVRLGIAAPIETTMHRQEVYERIQAQQRESDRLNARPRVRPGLHRRIDRCPTKNPDFRRGFLLRGR